MRGLPHSLRYGHVDAEPRSLAAKALVTGLSVVGTAVMAGALLGA